MSKSGHHSVQKYLFDIHYDSEKEAINFQNELLLFIRDELLDISDTVFTEITPDAFYRIPQLEINLGTVSKDSYQPEVKERLKERLREELHLLIYNSHVNNGGIKAEKIHPSSLDWEALCYFMEHGIMPWSSYKGDTTFSVNMLLDNVLVNYSRQLKELVERERRNNVFLLRIIRQWNDDKKWVLLSWWIEEEKLKFIKLFFTDLIRIYAVKKIATNYLAEYKELIWIFLFEQIITIPSEALSEKNLFERFIEYLSIKMKRSTASVVLLFKSILFSNKSFIQDSSLSDYTFSLFSERNNLEFGFNKYLAEYKSSDAVFNPKPQDTTVSDLIKRVPESENGSENQLIAKVEHRLEKRKKWLIQLLTILVTPEGKRFFSNVEVLDQLIREYYEADPVGLKRIFSELTISLRSYPDFEMLETLPSSLRLFIIHKVFEKEHQEYERLKEKAATEFFLSFLGTGEKISSYSLIVKGKKEWSRLADQVMTNEKQELLKRIQLMPADKVLSFIQLLNETLSSAVLKKHSGFFDQLEKNFQTGRIVFPLEKKVMLTDAGLNQQVYFILFFLKEKKLPDNCGFTMEELLFFFTRKQEKEALLFFSSLKEKDRKILLSLAADRFRSLYFETIKNINAQLDLILEEYSRTRDEEAFLAPVEDSGKTLSQSDDPVYTSKKVKEGEPVYINNAGLVIFHPYLSRFFKLLDLMDKSSFKDEYSAHKAAYILQYLASKMSFSEEHELFLNKILCGIEPETPLMKEVEITEEDRAVCENLIEGVIVNWPILKKTSNDNFRASFLLREGKLVLEPQGWKLRVEERAYDILVEKIPWSIGMVMLPWMKKMIYVEWK